MRDESPPAITVYELFRLGVARAVVILGDINRHLRSPETRAEFARLFRQRRAARNQHPEYSPFRHRSPSQDSPPPDMGGAA